MQNNQKEQIKAKLAEYCAKYESQNKAANSLKGVSAGTISQVLNNNWDMIADEMFMKIAKQIGFSSKELNVVQTTNFKFLTKILKDAALNSIVYSVVGNAGTGKTITAKQFAETNKRSFRLECNEYWNRKMFLRELLSLLGRPSDGQNVNEMMNEIVATVKTMDCPIIIFDEFDKVNDQILFFFITLYNQLEDECAIVTLSTDHLITRVKRGLRLNKKGYKEFYSRIGSKFVEMPGVTASDIASISMANGITNKAEVKEVIEDCGYDLRRAKRKIHALKNAA